MADVPAMSRNACKFPDRNVSDSAVRWSVTASFVIRLDFGILRVFPALRDQIVLSKVLEIAKAKIRPLMHQRRVITRRFPENF